MSDTPRTDAEAMNGAFKDQGCTITLQQWDYYKTTDGEVVMVEFARQLERELNAAKAENADMRATMQIIYDAADSCADGAPDASDHDKLCLELTHTLQPHLK